MGGAFHFQVAFFFVVGAAFSHYVVFPIVCGFFAGFRTDYLTFMLGH